MMRTLTPERSGQAHLETGCPTLPQLLLRWEGLAPSRVTLRRKELGRWREITFAEWAVQSRAVGAGLTALGVQRGDRVGILADNRPEWLYGMIAVQGLGAIAFGVYTTSPAAQVAYHVNDAGATVLIVDNQEQLDKALEIVDDCPSLRHVLVMDRKGTAGPGYHDPRIIHWDAVVDRGRAELARDPEAWDREVALAEPDDVSVLVYTSGTTGPPKGAMLTWRNWQWFFSGAARIYDLSPSDEVVSYLPLCHVAEQSMTVGGTLGCGLVANFAESIETVQADVREVQPTVWYAVPRISEKLLASIESRVADSTPLKRFGFAIWSRLGYWLAGRRLSRRPHRLLWYEQLLRLPCWLFLFRSIKKQMGFSRVRLALSGAAPISPEVLRFFLAMDIPILEGYGQTECMSATSNALDDMELGTVGRPVPGAEVLLADDGEILLRGPAVFAGYWNKPDATAETVDADGWVHTGDIGEWTSDRRLRIVDRKRDIIITAGGKNLSPTEIENRIKASRFIKEAVVIGDRRAYVAALLQIEYDIVADWAQRERIPFTTYEDLSQQPEVHELCRDAVAKANEGLSRVEQVRRFRVLPREFDVDDGEVTPTQKVRRRVVAERYADVIEEMYRS